MIDILGHNYIGGTRSALGSKIVKSYDACTGEPLPFNFSQATIEEVDKSAKIAAEAFSSYRNLPAVKRADFLDAIADEIDGLSNEFLELVVRETALPFSRIDGERGRTSNQMRLFASVLRRGYFHGARIDSALPDRKPSPRVDLRQYRIGIGPVAVFGASNFPLAFSTAGGDTASALAAGCPVVFKAHSGHMATAECIADAIIRAARKTGMPDGVFNMIYGSGIGGHLVKHESIQAVGFTGSLKGGRAIYDMGASRSKPIPVFAEMSSINPVILLPEAIKTRGSDIARELSSSVTLGCGQFCTKPGLVIGLQSPEFSAFINEFVKVMAEQKPQTMLNAGTLSSYKESLASFNMHQGVRRLSSDIQDVNQAEPHVYMADISLLLSSDELLQEEVFGPTTVIVEVSDREELAHVLRELQGQLTATVIGEKIDLAGATDLLILLEQMAGRVLINSYPTGVEVSDAMVHGGPYPATTDSRGTSVGTLAIDRFLRPVCYQNWPDELLPEPLKNANSFNIPRLVDGTITREKL